MSRDQQFDSLKKRVFGKEKKTDLIDTYHYLMIHYGWIPFGEFKKLDAYLVGELVNKLNKMNEQQNKQFRRKR